jgi:hypothetical protein
MNHPFMETLIWALKSPFFGQISDICSIPWQVERHQEWEP